MPDATQESSKRSSSTMTLIVCWLLVGLPAAWGVEQTIMKSIPLFRGGTPTAPTTMPVGR